MFPLPPSSADKFNCSRTREICRHGNGDVEVMRYCSGSWQVLNLTRLSLIDLFTWCQRTSGDYLTPALQSETLPEPPSNYTVTVFNSPGRGCAMHIAYSKLHSVSKVKTSICESRFFSWAYFSRWVSRLHLSQSALAAKFYSRTVSWIV